MHKKAPLGGGAGILFFMKGYNRKKLTDIGLVFIWIGLLVLLVGILDLIHLYQSASGTNVSAGCIPKKSKIAEPVIVNLRYQIKNPPVREGSQFTLVFHNNSLLCCW